MGKRLKRGSTWVGFRQFNRLCCHVSTKKTGGGVESRGAKLALKINDHQTQAWIDSGSPISFFTIGELKRNLGTLKVQLQHLDPKDDQFRDYGINPLKIMGKMVVTFQSNGWTTRAAINVIGGCRPSIIGR